MNGTTGNINSTDNSRTVRATVHPIEDINIFELTHDELKALTGNSLTKSLFSVLTGISFSACISFIITISTITIAEAKLFATIIAIILVFGLSFLICGFFWIKAEILAHKTNKKYSDKLK